jgi:hypothetical protein
LALGEFVPNINALEPIAKIGSYLRNSTRIKIEGVCEFIAKEVVNDAVKGLIGEVEK